ncbi:cell wall protein [Neobacillus sp. MM2021_6]|uniref:TasA family protein n=1 Tax=Bacillaceae TaxID=186817 RepID=UPI001409477D|nr:MULTISPECIES: TasA family protein [Bacillaceae]MBO0958281.1 cell wall protein [Neobacillus sp. MM2021_6]NHC17881.1 cell wall protein [Bacillus sp. MM2020_4]
MNEKKVITILVCYFLLLTVFILAPFAQDTYASEIQEIDIATSPEKVLFDLNNLKPGDWAERTLTIQNKGKQDFKYLFSSKLNEGSGKFYNALELKVSDKNKVLFEGKMHDFSKLEPRFISKNDEEELFFTVKIPDELGNEYQGLNCKVEFKFYVEGTFGGVLPVDGPKLPETGTNMFTILVAGAALVITGGIFQFVLYWRRKMAREA